MTDKFPPVMQRPRLLQLAEKAEISFTQLRRDLCVDWMLHGNFGHVYALPYVYQILITGWSTQGWNICKREFAFATLTQDGDDEGAFMLDRDPTPDEAEIIRKRVGLRKRRAISDEGLAALRSRLAAFRAA
jgi:hypothetical protein